MVPRNLVLGPTEFIIINEKLFSINAVAAATPVAGSRAPEVPPGNELQEQPSGAPGMDIHYCTSKAVLLVVFILEHNPK